MYNIFTGTKYETVTVKKDVDLLSKVYASSMYTINTDECRLAVMTLILYTTDL